MSKKEKLVRDNIIHISKAEGDGCQFRIATEGEMPSLFHEKIQEECEEVCQELLKSTVEKDKLTEELADVLEVVDSICQHFGITPEDLSTMKSRKKSIKGSFVNRVVRDLSDKKE